MTAPLPRLGDRVEPRDVQPPDGSPLAGRTVILRRLDPGAHGAGLHEALNGPNADRGQYDYMGYGPFATAAEFRAFLEPLAEQRDPLWYTILDRDTGDGLGLAAYLRIDPADRVLEIGHLNFGQRMQRSTQATEAIYLLIAKAFAHGYRRVEWKCNNLNERSKRAAARFGFTPEGVFRQHMIVKGRNRDTAWFAITDADWPAIRDEYVRWLAPPNFNPDGSQKSHLSMPASS